MADEEQRIGQIPARRVKHIFTIAVALFLAIIAIGAVITLTDRPDTETHSGEPPEV
jgi:hypothetical protein